MIFKKLPNPYYVSVMHSYANEGDENAICNIGSLPEHSGFRRAVLDAMDDEHLSCDVSYYTLQERCEIAKMPVNVEGSVTLYEDERVIFDGYTLSDDDDEMDMWVGKNPDSPLIDIFNYLRNV